MKGWSAVLVLLAAALPLRAFAGPLQDVSFKLRALAQFDVAAYEQSAAARLLPPAYGPELSSGSNFRRLYLGVQGTAFEDWSYGLTVDFGGSGGTETAGHIQSAFVQFDASPLLHLKVGAYPPPVALEDSTAPQDTLFQERTAPSDVMRNTAAGDGRDAVSLLYTGGRLFAAVSWTGGKVGDGPVFGEQSAVVARLSAIALKSADYRWVASVGFVHVFHAPDMASGHPLTLSASPELTVDSTGTKLVSTGALTSDGATEWAIESGATWHSVFAQAGYFRYQVARPALPAASFSGWYAEASWVLTGESRGFNEAAAAFTMPQPKARFSRERGNWGAWEVAARYSGVDLDFDPGVAGAAAPAGGVRGGRQRIWSAALNWYPNSFLHLSVGAQDVSIARLANAAPFAAIGQHYHSISARMQFSL